MGSRMFFLMHQNDVVAPLEIDEESGDAGGISEIGGGTVYAK